MSPVLGTSNKQKCQRIWNTGDDLSLSLCARLGSSVLVGSLAPNSQPAFWHPLFISPQSINKSHLESRRLSIEELTVIVQLCCIIFHHLQRLLDCILAVKLGPRLVCLLIRVLIDEEIFNGASTRRSLVDSKARGKLSVCTYLNSVQHCHGKGLA